MDRGFPRALRLVLNQATEVILDYAAPRVPRRTGRAQASLKGRSTQRSARVAGGSARAPHYPWLDFGGKVGRGRGVDRPFYKDGRYLYKAYAVKRDEFEELMARGLVELARSAGVQVDHRVG